tara:strand:+ start:71 stop:364 length:294 start_codon:yes stop_codon:yes gene_type:complete
MHTHISVKDFYHTIKDLFGTQILIDLPQLDLLLIDQHLTHQGQAEDLLHLDHHSSEEDLLHLDQLLLDLLLLDQAEEDLLHLDHHSSEEDLHLQDHL